MSTASLSITTGFATGVPVALLPFASPQVMVREAVDNSDALQCAIVLPTASIPGTTAVPVGVASTVRLYGADGVQREYRITSLNESPDQRFATITAQPPIIDLGTAGMVRTDSNGETIFTFGGSLTVSQWLTGYVLTNLSQDGLTWLSATPGTIDVDAVVTLQWSRYNRMQLLQAIVAGMDGAPEFYLSQSAPGAQYQLCVGWRNGTRPTLTIAPDLNAIKRARSFDDGALCTVIEPSGDTIGATGEPATITEHAWTPTVLTGGWVALQSPNGGPSPIQFLDQFNTDATYFLEVPNGTSFDYRQILDTDKTDSSVQLSDTTLMSDTACLVRIVRSNSGAPITQIPNPLGLASYGRIVKPASFEGTRGERNWFPNPVARLGSVHWNATGAAWMEVIPKSETTDLIALANGASANGTANLPVDGVAPGTVFRRGTTFKVGATNELLFVATTTTANGSGQATIPLLGVVAGGTVPDNDTLTFYRNTYGWPSEGGANMLRFKGVDPSFNAFTSDAFLVPLRGSAPRTAWARLDAVLWMPVTTTGIASTTPVQFEVTDSGGTNIVTQTASVPTPVITDARPAPVAFSINLQFPVTSSALRKLRLSSPYTSQSNGFYGLYVTGCSVYITPDSDVPLIDGSHANTLWQKGHRQLVEAHAASPNVTAQLVDLSQVQGAQLVADGLRVGQSVYVRDFNVTQRAVAITRDHLDPRKIDVQCASLPVTLSDQLAA